MIKSRINKKKTSVNFILKFISILLFTIVFVVIFYEFYQSNLVNTLEMTKLIVLEIAQMDES